MKTSIRLLLTALAVSGITFAAAGVPLPKDGGVTGGGGHPIAHASPAHP